MKILFIFTFYLVSVTGDSTNEVTAYSGGGVRIKCKYEEEHKTNNKYFCKGESTPCADQIKTGAKHTWVHEGRFSLYDNTSAKVFWVVIRNLTVEDSGTYQCAVDIKRWTDKYKAVKLKVKAGFPSSTVVSIVCVILILVRLLMGTSFLIVTFRKRSKMQASCKGQPLQDVSHNHWVPLAVFDYEEIKDTRHNGAPTVYSTVCLPTNPSDPSKTVYALAQPLSCSHDMDIYSTAQLPTTPSDSSVGHVPQLASTSAEGFT